MEDKEKQTARESACMPSAKKWKSYCRRLLKLSEKAPEQAMESNVFIQ